MKPYTDIMLDLETLGTGNNAAIIQIGAVAFDADGDHAALFTNSPDTLLRAGRGFRMNVDLENSKHSGDIDPSTVKWWLGQSEQARASIVQTKGEPLGEALKAFAEWVRKVSNWNEVRLWSNGPTFDEVITRAAFARYGYELPTKFWNSRCCRTMSDIAMKVGWEPNAIPPNVLQHDGLADAVYQARVVTDQRYFLKRQGFKP